MNAFAAWIKQAGLTKHDVAVAWGVQDPAIAKVTRDGYTAGPEMAQRIWRFTGGAVLMDARAVGNPQASKEHRAALKAIRAAERRRLAKAGPVIPANARPNRNAELYARWQEVRNQSQVGREYGLSQTRVREIIDNERRNQRRARKDSQCHAEEKAQTPS